MPFTVHPHPTGGYVIAVLGRTPLPAIFDSRAQAQDAADYLSTRSPRPAAPASPPPTPARARTSPGHTALLLALEKKDDTPDDADVR